MKRAILSFVFASLVAIGCKKGSPDSTTNSGDGSIQTPLTITDFSPKAGKPGTTITITGTGFGTDPSRIQVSIGNSTFSHPQAVAPTTITFQTDQNTPAGKINIISNINSQVSVSSKDEFNALPDLVVYGLDGDNRLGELFGVQGKNFGTDTNKIFFSFGGTTPVKANFVSAYGLQAQTRIPRYAKEGKVTLTVNTVSFTLDSVLRFRTCIADFTPKSFHVGDTVTITGYGFTTVSDMNINFNNNKVTRPFSVTPTQMAVKVPQTAVSGSLGVSSDKGPSINAVNYGPTPYTILK